MTKDPQAWCCTNCGHHLGVGMENVCTICKVCTQRMYWQPSGCWGMKKPREEEGMSDNEATKDYIKQALKEQLAREVERCNHICEKSVEAEVARYKAAAKAAGVDGEHNNTTINVVVTIDWY
jgi:hypothetical protein